MNAGTLAFLGVVYAEAIFGHCAVVIFRVDVRVQRRFLFLFVPDTAARLAFVLRQIVFKDLAEFIPSLLAHARVVPTWCAAEREAPSLPTPIVLK